MAIIKTLKESKILAKGKPRQTIYPVTSSDAVIVPNRGKLTTVLSKVAFSNNYNDLDNLPANISAFNNDVGYLTSFTETDPTVPLWAKQNTKPSYNYSEILNTPILATVATSGNYNDLINKPTIPTVPTNVSAFNNDAGYLTTETDPTVPNHVKGITQQNITNWNGKVDSSDLANYYTKSEVNSALGGKQIKDFAIDISANYSQESNVFSNLVFSCTMQDIIDAYNANKRLYVHLSVNRNTELYLYLVSVSVDIQEGTEGVKYFTFNSGDEYGFAQYVCYIQPILQDSYIDRIILQEKVSDLATIRSGAALGATAYQKPNGGIPKSDLANSVQTSLGKADTALQQHQDLSSYADCAEYDSSAKKIYLKHGNIRLSNPIDATAFIKDGMIDTVTVTNGNLVISFNTDAGKQPISLPISGIFNANNYYTKTEIDNKGYLTSETDPVFGASVASSITSTNIDDWNNKQNKIAPPEVGSLYRSDVSGSGSITIRGTKGTFPHVNYAGTYTLITSMQSSTQTYGLSITFGGNTYSLSTTNGTLEDTRTLTVDEGAIWSASVTGNVAANTIISVKILSALDEITEVGMVAVTNNYNDLDNKPTIPTVNNGKLTIQKNGSNIQTFTANQSSNVTANIVVPTKLSDLNNDSGFITGYTETDPIYSASVAAGITSSDISNWNSKTSNIGTITGITMNGVSKGTSGVVNLGTVVTSETDPTVPAWAKAANKPTYTASEVGALPSTTQIPSKTSDLTNDSGFITGYTETDPTVPSWAKQSTKPSYSYSEISGTPTLANVATSGSYNDLSNKPTIPTVPTNVSAFTNDAGYLTSHQDISGKQDNLTAGDGIAIDNTDTIRTVGIPYGKVDSTSTSTIFTATVPGIDRLEDGVCVLLKNGVVTSAKNFTININGLGAKHCYTNMAAATMESTIFNVNYTMLFVYDSTRVTGGGWICYRGYDSDSNTNTVGYLLRGNNSTMKTTDASRYYKIFFTSADGTHWVPASVNSTNNATSARPVNQRPIDPFGRIMYTSANTNYPAGSTIAVATLWSQYPLSLGYSFNRTGAELTLTASTPVYVKCTPQTDGSAIIDADVPYVQALPTTNDGKIYIFLGIAYNATNIELYNNHPVYYHDGTGIRLWTGSTGGGADLTNYYTKSEVDTALSGKQATLVSGTNLKTINNTSLLGSGNVAVQPTLVSGTNIKTINNESLLGSGNITISGGGGGSVQSDWNQTDTTADDYIKNKPDVLPISYDANTTTLVIGVSSGYTITFDSSLENVDFMDSENNTIDKTSPVLVASSSSFYCRTASSRHGMVLAVTMDNVNISSSVVTDHVESNGPIDEFWYEISVPSVTGNVVISKHV